MSWDITLRKESRWESFALPPAILTSGPGFPETGMPNEVALLLPNQNGASSLISAVLTMPSYLQTRALGLFLADPFFNARTEAARMRDTGIKWIANLPSVEQQDQEFVQLLGDVGLDRNMEIERLKELAATGFHILAVVAGPEAAEAAAKINPAAVFVIPRVIDFAAGFPSFRQRGAAAKDVHEAVTSAGWTGPLLGLAAESEIAHETLWPDVLDGVVCRPVPIAAFPAAGEPA